MLLNYPEYAKLLKICIENKGNDSVEQSLMSKFVITKLVYHAFIAEIRANDLIDFFCDNSNFKNILLSIENRLGANELEIVYGKYGKMAEHCAYIYLKYVAIIIYIKNNNESVLQEKLEIITSLTLEYLFSLSKTSDLKSEILELLCLTDATESLKVDEMSFLVTESYHGYIAILEKYKSGIYASVLPNSLIHLVLSSLSMMQYIDPQIIAYFAAIGECYSK